jgi:predicted Fe-Mo cluster-binding NifX family protein
MTYKIATVTEDGQGISSHFGMAPHYRVFTIEDGKVVSEETLAKPHHSHHPGSGHGHDHSHDDMFAPIANCRVLICGGMGTPAYEKARAAGLEVLLTGGDIHEAVQSYLAGQISSDQRRIHLH